MREAGREMFEHIVSVVRYVAGHALSHSYARFCTKTGQVQVNVEIQQLVSDWASIRGISRLRGTNSNDLEGSYPI